MNSMLHNYLESHRRAVQLRELEILCEIDKICRRHSITYWLDGGTLLGAVRHGGFIPWDDDIDIAMPLEELPRFAEAAQKELPATLMLQHTATGSGARLPICKVRDLNSFLVEASDDFARPYEKGLYVDIFPMIPYPTLGKKFVKKVTRGYCRANAILQSQHYYSLRSFAEFFYFGAKRAACGLLWQAASLFAKKGEYTGNVLNNNGYGIMHRTGSIFPTKEIRFEGRTFSGPACPEAYLTDLYHDYMEIPPMERRGGHAVFYAERLS